MVNLQNTPAHVENYIRLLELVCEPDYCFALFDKQHSILWAAEGYNGPKEIPVSVVNIELKVDCELVKLSDEKSGSFYIQAFQIYQKGAASFVIVQCKSQLTDKQMNELSHRLQLAQGSIAESDYSQACISNKAKEVQEMHYNYQPNLNATAPENVDSEVSLLLQDCVRSLELIGAFIYSVDSKRLLSNVPDESLLEGTGLSALYRNTVVQRDLYRLCETSSSAFFIDQKIENESQSTLDGLHNLKVMVTPLLDSGNECKGALVCVRANDAGKFTKSELRLSEMMSEHGLKILCSRYDLLTGFLNPGAYNIVIEGELSKPHDSNDQSSFLILRLGSLDKVYKSGGLEAGSHVLSQVVALLSKRVRSRDFAGRLAKDEFALILHNCNSENAQLMAEQLLESFSQFTFEWQGTAIKLEAWVGLLEFSSTFVSADNLIRAGREAAQVAYEDGSYKHAVFQGSKNTHQELNRLGWEHRIYKTVINKDFRLFCQPIEDAGAYSDGIQRYELLLRLKNKDDVLLAPNVFIMSASKAGLMGYVDRWVVAESFRLSRSVNTHHAVSLFNFTINLSADSLSSDFANYIIRQAEQFGVLADSICFDLTESDAMKDLKKTNRFVNLLRKRGFEVALDDFGTGIGAYSSLRSLSLDYVKLDGNLVKNIANDSVSAAIVASICKVCRAMGIKTIAESVENEIVKEHLKRTDVDFIQGYQTARPRSVTEEFEEYYGAKTGSCQQ